MHVLVIGGTRFVGYLLTWRLLAAGHEVTLFNRGRLADPFGARVHRVVGDRSTDEFDQLRRHSFNACVDFACYTAHDAVRAVEVLADRVDHYVLISTGQVYLVRQPRPTLARETDYDGPVMAAPQEPSERSEWDYGMGKRGAEDVLIEAWANRRFPATRLRIPMVNGERDYFRRVESYAWRILDGGAVLVPDGGQTPMRHVYGADIARQTVALLGNPTTFGQAYNLAQSDTFGLVDSLTLLAELLGAPPRLLAVPSVELYGAGLDASEISPFSSSWMSFIDPERAQSELGFRPQSLSEYLPKIVASFLAAPPAEPPENYRHRASELRLASKRVR